MSDELLALAARCEAADGPDREVDRAIKHSFGHDWDYSADWDYWDALKARKASRPVAKPYTASVDAAMTLFPTTATNVSLNQFNSGWNCRFHDTAQQMGERAAKEQIARLQVGGGIGNVLRGPAVVVLEKAIAEHWIEFYCLRAITPALAMCAAALRAKATTVIAIKEGGVDE